MSDDSEEPQNITVEYTDMFGEEKHYTFTDVTEIVTAGDPDNPAYVLIGQRNVEEGKENDVLDGVIRVKNEYVLADGKLPRHHLEPDKTVAEVQAEEAGLI